MKALQIRVAIEIQPERPVTAAAVEAMLEDLRAQGVQVAIEGPTADELDGQLDEVLAEIEAGNLPEPDRRELRVRVEQSRTLNRFVRRMGR